MLRAGLLTPLFAGPLLTGCSREVVDTLPVVHGRLRPFDRTRPPGPPTGLPRRVAWANTSDTEIFVSLGKGMHAAADDAGLEYLTANAEADPARNIAQLETFLSRGVGALGVQPLDQVAQGPVLQRAIDAKVCVQGIITAPSVFQVVADQYDLGFQQGKAAAEWVRKRRGGKAQVAYFNQDGIAQQLMVRHHGVLAGLRTGGPGIQVVSDISANERAGAMEGGYSAMTDILQDHPGISVVMGSDTVTTGAYRAFEQLDMLSDDLYFSGVDGDRNALALVEQAGPYRASFAFQWGLMGYGMGAFGAEWIDGKDVPRVLVAKVGVLDSAAKVATYRAMNDDPASVWADPGRYARLLPLLGNVGAADLVQWNGAYEL